MDEDVNSSIGDINGGVSGGAKLKWATLMRFKADGVFGLHERHHNAAVKLLWST